MNTIQIYARLKIHKGRLDDFKAAASKCMQLTREKDKGCLQYDWFLNEDGTECVVREQYRDSKAVLEHIANLGEALGTLFSYADAQLDLCGDLSPELVKATAATRPSVYGYLHGL